MKNCFTYAPLVGVIDGIKLSVDLQAFGGGVLSPRVTVGAGFVQVDRQQPARAGDGNIVTTARLKQINRANGRPLYTLAEAGNAPASIICLINLNLIPQGVKLKHDPETINAWVTFRAEGSTNIIMYDAGHGRALVEFTADNQAVLVFDRDGMVYLLVRRNGQLETESLTPGEMAKERVRVFRSMIDQLGEVDWVTDRRVHGIIGGAVRLLGQALRYPVAVDVLVDFLIEFIGDGLTDNMRKQIRGLLDSVGHPHTVMFADGFGSTVVRLAPRGDSTARQIAERKRKERSERDRDARNRAKGGSGGGDKKNKKRTA